MDFRPTTLRKDPYYILFYVHWAQLIITGILPFLHMTISNSIIIYKIKTRKSESDSLDYGREMPGHSTVTLTMIILVYFASNMPRLSLNFIEYLYSDDLFQYDHCHCLAAAWWLGPSIRFSHLMLAIGSSINFFIYYLASKRFRKVLSIRWNSLNECTVVFCK